MTSAPNIDEQHQALLRRLSAASSLVFGLVLVASSRLPLFDASPILVPDAHSPLLRWDILHFLHIARHGYVYEHEWAFLPAAPWIIRHSLAFLEWLTHSNITLSHLILAIGVSVLASETVQTLYLLSRHHFKAPHMALLASLLAILPSSPATLLFVPYNEPFFTYLSYRGMLACARRHWTLASLLFALASTFRSNGILLSGFIIWGLVVEPSLQRQTTKITSLIKCICLVALVISPFIAYQFAAYITFCSDVSSTDIEWCANFPPSIYTHVQSAYWNVGFLRYWTLAQIPNFLIASPPIIVILTFAFDHLSSFLSETKRKSIQPGVVYSLSLTPHAIHAVVFTFILLFASHTQIILRLAASMPFTYWAAAWLYLKYPTCGTAWVTWSVLYGLISVILWATFLPPA